MRPPSRHRPTSAASPRSQCRVRDCAPDGGGGGGGLPPSRAARKATRDPHVIDIWPWIWIVLGRSDGLESWRRRPSCCGSAARPCSRAFSTVARRRGQPAARLRGPVGGRRSAGRAMTRYRIRNARPPLNRLAQSLSLRVHAAAPRAAAGLSRDDRHGASSGRTRRRPSGGGVVRVEGATRGGGVSATASSGLAEARTRTYAW